MQTPLSDLYAKLTVDLWRSAHPFSKDIEIANEVLLFPYSRDVERREALENWLQGRHQPCLFGRIAAKNKGIHYCFLTTEDLLKSDDHVRDKIAASRALWKQRALRGEPRHGFMLSICDPRIALANPDEALRQFALRVQELAGWVGRVDINNNQIVDEWLYLRNPKKEEIVRFTFSVDFFASAGDNRWWHDHRIPGGLAFTANSLGHMVRCQEWYQGKKDQTEWALRTAMLTIEQAAKVEQQRPATRLLDEIHGKPIRPYHWTEATPPPLLEKLKDKDCGSYGGDLHTDHAVRAEFFQPYETPSTGETPYMMDFTYIFDPESPDYEPFMVGKPVDENAVVADLGRPQDQRLIAADHADVEHGLEIEGAQLPGRIRDALAETRSWKLTDDEEASLH
jgi:hypothetical protein